MQYKMAKDLKKLGFTKGSKEYDNNLYKLKTEKSRAELKYKNAMSSYSKTPIGKIEKGAKKIASGAKFISKMFKETKIPKKKKA